MHLSYSALILGTLSLECALAQPTNHRHTHKSRRDLADVNWQDKKNYGGVDFNTVDYHMGGKGAQPSTTQAATTTATTVAVTNSAVSTSTSAPAAPSSQSKGQNPQEAPQSPSQSQSPSSGGAKLTFGGISSPKDDGNKDHYIGNVGMPYGSNMLKLDKPEHATDYKYSNTFSNPTSDKISVIVWNKSGKDGQAQSGMSLPANLKFDLGPKESVAVAFDENSQVSFAQDCERDPAKGNVPNCTWGEVDFGDLRNGGWSGYDRSSIPNGAGNTGLLTISCEGAQTSSQQSNSFTSAAQTNAGGSLAPGPAHFYTTMGA